MRWVLLTAVLLMALALSASTQATENDDFDDDNEFADVEENDFAEFDFEDEAAGSDARRANAPGDARASNAADEADFDDEEEFVNESPSRNAVEDEEEAVVEDVDSEFNHFADEEEFEGFNTEEDEEDEFEHMTTKGRGAKEKPSSKPSSPPPPKTIKITNIPAHLRTNWENYYLEMLMAAGIVVYFLNFFTGKAKNQRIANAWLNSHKAMLESNFSLVGDDGTKNIDEIETQLQKESENLFTLWCSGRTCCEGMLVELKLLKRQDLVAVIANLMKPAHDQVFVPKERSKSVTDPLIIPHPSRLSSAELPVLGGPKRSLLKDGANPYHFRSIQCFDLSCCLSCVQSFREIVCIDFFKLPFLSRR
jgi:hypothetical protein